MHKRRRKGAKWAWLPRGFNSTSYQLVRGNKSILHGSIIIFQDLEVPILSRIVDSLGMATQIIQFVVFGIFIAT